MTTSAALETGPVSRTDRTFCAQAVTGRAATIGKNSAKTRQVSWFMGSALASDRGGLKRCTRYRLRRRRYAATSGYQYGGGVLVEGSTREIAGVASNAAIAHAAA